MTLGKAACLAVAILLLPARAEAVEVPSCANSTMPACITLVGSDGTIASGLGTFTVVIRDLASNPVVGTTVVVDLSNAADMHLCAQQLAPGIVVDCPNGTASAVTDANGRATFTLLGGSNGAGNATTLLNGGRIYAFGGVLCASPSVAAYDLDGASGVGANDLSAWLNDFGSGNPYGRSDYDCSGSLGANDFSLWLSAFGAGTQVASCTASCPWAASGAVDAMAATPRRRLRDEALSRP